MENSTTVSNPAEEKTKRQLLVERMAKRYPDRSFDNDDDLYDQVSQDYDSSEEELKGYKEREGVFNEMFASDPRTANIFLAFKKDSKKHPLVAMAEQFGPEFREALDDPEKLEGLAEANQAYVERMAKNKELEEEYAANMEKSLAYLDELEANGTDEKTISDATELITKIANEVVMGVYSPEAMNMAMKALNHDADVAEAAHVGEVKGQNKKIKETLRKAKAGDGTARLDGKNNTSQPQRKRNLGALDRMSERQSIWGDKK